MEQRLTEILLLLDDWRLFCTDYPAAELVYLYAVWIAFFARQGFWARPGR